MSEEPVSNRIEIVLGTSVFGTHVNSLDKGFTIVDVRFLFELFLNWMGSSSAWGRVGHFDDQISEYIDTLLEKGLAKKISRKDESRYKLTRVGVKRLIYRAVSVPYLYADDFYFIYSYIENYAPRTLAMISREGKSYPYDERIEIEGLLDLEELIRKQQRYLNKRLKALNNRIDMQLAANKYVEELLAGGESFEDVATKLEKKYPYVLNSMKPFSEFVARGTAKQALWELCEGGTRRVEQMWNFERAHLELHLAQLDELKEQSARRLASDDRYEEI